MRRTTSKYADISRSSGTALQVAHAVLRDPQRGHQLARDTRALIRLDEPQRRAALDDRAVEQSLRGRHRQQRGHLSSATRLPEDHHRVRIAAELGDVVAHPAQRGDDVHHADVAGRGELLTAGFLERREAEDVEAVIDGDDDHVTAARQIEPFGHW